MTIPLVDLTAQYKSIKPEIDEAIARVVNRGQFILGQELAAFESEVAKYIDIRFAIGVASGTDALFLSLRALDIGQDDTVITTPFTFIATAESIARCGAQPAFADIDKSGNLDLDKAEYLLKQKNRLNIKAILPVHLYGNPINMDNLMQLAKKYSLLVVEDCAQAWGASWNGQKVGSFGNTGCFSSFPSKVLGGYGDAGIITTEDDKIATMLRKLRNHGASTHYMYDEHGINSRLDELQSAILRVKLNYLDEWIDKRENIAHKYSQELRHCVKPLDLVRKEARHAWNYYTVLADHRDGLRDFLARQGIHTAIYYPLSLHLQKVYSYLGYQKGDFPVAESLQEQVISLPMYPELSAESISQVCEAIHEFYQK